MAGAMGAGVPQTVLRREDVRMTNPRTERKNAALGVVLSPIGAVDVAATSITNLAVNSLNALGADLDEVESYIPEGIGISDSTRQIAREVGGTIGGIATAIAAPPTILRSTGPILGTAARLGLSPKLIARASVNQERSNRLVRNLKAKEEKLATDLGALGLRGTPMADRAGLQERAARALLPGNKKALAADTSRGAAKRRARSQAIADNTKLFLAGELTMHVGFHEVETLVGENYDLGDVLTAGAFGVLPVGAGMLQAGHMSRTALSNAQLKGNEAFQEFRRRQISEGKLTSASEPGAFAQGVDAWFGTYDNAIQAQIAMNARGQLTGEAREVVDKIVSTRTQMLSEGMQYHAKQKPFQLRNGGPETATGPEGRITGAQGRLIAEALMDNPRYAVGVAGVHGIDQLTALKGEHMKRIEKARKDGDAVGLNDFTDYEMHVVEPRFDGLLVDAQGSNTIARAGGVNAQERAIIAERAAAEADAIVANAPPPQGQAAIIRGNVEQAGNSARFDPFADIAPGKSAVWIPDNYSPAEQDFVRVLGEEFDLQGTKVLFLDDDSPLIDRALATPRLRNFARTGEFNSATRGTVGGNATNSVIQRPNDIAIVRLNRSGKNDTTPLSQLEVLAHEFGHVMEKQLLLNSGMEDAIRAAWDEAKKRRTLRNGTVKDQFDDEFPPAIGRNFERNQTRAGLAPRTTRANQDSHSQRINTYDEWIANQIARYVFDETPANTVVDKFFKSIAKMWRRIGEKLGARPEYINKDVRKWLDSVRTRKSVPDLKAPQRRAQQMRDVDALPFAAASRQRDFLDTAGTEVIQNREGIRLKDHKNFRLTGDGGAQVDGRKIRAGTVLNVTDSTAYQAALEGVDTSKRLRIKEDFYRPSGADHFIKLHWLAGKLEDESLTVAQTGGANSQQLRERALDLQIDAIRKLTESGQINDYLPSDLSKATGLKLFNRDNEYTSGAEALLLLAADIKPGRKLSDLGTMDDIAEAAAGVAADIGYQGDALNTVRTQVKDILQSPSPNFNTRKRTDAFGVETEMPKPAVVTSRYAQRPPTQLAEQIDTLSAQATRHRKELLGGEGSHWLIRGAVNAMRNNEVAYRQINEPYTLHHESLRGQSRITTREFAAGESSVLQAAHILATESDRVTNKAIERVMGDVVGLTNNARRKGNEHILAQHSVYTKAFRAGLTPDAEVVGVGLVKLDMKDAGNRKAIKRLFEKSNPTVMSDLLSGRRDVHMFDPTAALKGSYVPIKLDDDASQLINAIANLQYDVLAAHNVARRAVNKSGVKQRNGHVPPENFADKKIAFFRSASNPTQRVVGFTAADTTAELDAAVRRALQSDPSLVRADDLSIEQHMKYYDDIYNEDIVDFRNPLQQTGQTKNTNLDESIDVSGSLLVGQLESVRDGYRRAVTNARKLEFERTINFAKQSHAQSGFDTALAGKGKQLGRAPKPAQYSAQQELLRVIEGRSDIAPGSIIGQVNDTITDGADAIFAYAAERLGLGTFNLSRSQREVADRLWKNGSSAQFFSGVDDVFARANLQSPFSGANLSRKQQRVNGAVATATLRFGQVGHPLLNLTSLMVTAPAVARRLARGVDETPQQFRERFGPVADFINADIATINPTKLMAEGLYYMFRPTDEMKAAYKAAGDRGYFDASVAEQTQKAFYGRTPSNMSEAFDRVIEMGSTLSDNSEILSRRLAWGMGYALSKRLNKPHALSEQDHYAFSHWFANQTIGNYDPKVRPDVFRGVSGVSAGLFQTFALNYMQRLVDMVEKKEYKALAVQGILQGGMFGLASLPGYDTLSGIIGNQYAEDPNLTDRIYNTMGKQAADLIWMGGLSNLPKVMPGTQEGIAFFSRGAVSPPQVPTALGDMAAFSMLGDAYEGVKKGVDELKATGTITRQRIAELTAAYAPVRAAKTIAELSIGQSVNRNGDLMDGDIYSFSGVVGSLLGSRTGDVARASDALWKNYGYSQRHRQRIKRLSDSYVAWHRANNGSVPKDVEAFFKDELLELSTERGATRMLKNWRDKARRPVTERRADAAKNDVNPLRLQRLTENEYDPAYDDVALGD